MKIKYILNRFVEGLAFQLILKVSKISLSSGGSSLGGSSLSSLSETVLGSSKHMLQVSHSASSLSVSSLSLDGPVVYRKKVKDHARVRRVCIHLLFLVPGWPEEAHRFFCLCHDCLPLTLLKV